MLTTSVGLWKDLSLHTSQCCSVFYLWLRLWGFRLGPMECFPNSVSFRQRRQIQGTIYFGKVMILGKQNVYVHLLICFFSLLTHLRADTKSSIQLWTRCANMSLLCCVCSLTVHLKLGGGGLAVWFSDLLDLTWLQKPWILSYHTFYLPCNTQHFKSCWICFKWCKWSFVTG